MENGFLRLDGRSAIVTGGARGIGLAISRRLLRAGAAVTIWDRDEAALRDAADQLDEYDGRVRAVRVDVSEPADVEAAARESLGEPARVDILVNNAGIVGRSAPVTELTDSDWDETIRTDLTGVFFCCRAVLPAMPERASIVNIASVAGKDGNPGQVPYAVAKAGVIALTKTLAHEVAPAIRVNCVAPALTQTRLLDELPREVLDYALERIPIGRVATPEEVAAVVHFLASDEASFVTGQCYDVSGGRSSY